MTSSLLRFWPSRSHWLQRSLPSVAEHRAIDEVRVILPLARLLVATTIVHSDAERHDGHARLRATKLRIAREIAAYDHSIDAHVRTSSYHVPAHAGNLSD